MDRIAGLMVLLLANVAFSQVALVSPDAGASLGSGDVTFVFNATDDLSASLNCSLVLDSSENVSGIAAANASETSVNVSGLAEGAHTWSVSCVDGDNNSSSSEVRNFTVELPSIPAVTLLSPENNATLNQSSALFVFSALEENESLNCTLLLDGAANASVAAVSGENASLNVSGLAEGTHNWSVSCTDEENETGLSETRTFTVDLDADDDGVGDGGDSCPASMADTMPKLNPNHYAQLNLSTSAFEAGPQMRQSLVYNMSSTKGCTCSQIVEKLGLGKGHLKKGCSPGIMQRWTGISFKSDMKAKVGKRK